MTPTEQLLNHVTTMVSYWASEIGNVPPETSKREALEGLAFSLLVMLDGGALEGGTWELRHVDDHGNVGDNIAGVLHELWSDLNRPHPDQFGTDRVNEQGPGNEGS